MDEYLTRFAKWVSVESSTPADPNCDFGEYSDVESLPEGVELADPSCPMRAILGCLQWLVSVTRVDIAPIVNVLSHFMRRPLMIHQVAICRVLGYLKRYPAECLHYKSDADFFLYAYSTLMRDVLLIL